MADNIVDLFKDVEDQQALLADMRELAGYRGWQKISQILTQNIEIGKQELSELDLTTEDGVKKGRDIQQRVFIFKYLVDLPNDIVKHYEPSGQPKADSLADDDVYPQHKKPQS